MANTMAAVVQIHRIAHIFRQYQQYRDHIDVFERIWTSVLHPYFVCFLWCLLLTEQYKADLILKMYLKTDGTTQPIIDTYKYIQFMVMVSVAKRISKQ